MTRKTIKVEPGTNHFNVVGVQQPHEVAEPEFTESGWPKNTVTDLTQLYIYWNPETGTWSITVCDKGWLK